MTDDLDKLRSAFRQESTVTARPDARKAAIDAALSRFEDQKAEKNSHRHQGSEPGARLMTRAAAFAASVLRRVFMTGSYQKLSYAMAGGVSLLALALVFNLNNLNEFKDLRGPMPQQAQEGAGTSSPLPKSEHPTNQPLGLIAPSEPEPMLERVEADAEVGAAAGTRAREVLAPAKLKRMQKQVAAPLAAAPAGRAVPSSALAPADDAASTAVYEEQGRDKFADHDDNPVKRAAEEPVSTFSADVDTASYAFVRKALNNGALPPKDAVRIEEMVNYFNYDYPLPDSRDIPFRADVEILPTPWNGETKLMRIGIKGYELERASAPPANLVFLLDTSGSMNAPDKLPLLQNAFQMLVSNLQPEDTVSIVAYAGSAGTVLEPTPASDTAKIQTALQNLSAGGSTAGGEGIRQAYQLAEQSFKKDGVNRVILATDGDFNVGIQNPEELKDFVERKRGTGISLSVLGFGRGNYNDLLMQELAQNGNGNASYIDTLSEARKVLVDEASSTLFPIAKDVKFQIEFNPSAVSEYRLIGYESRLLKREDFNNDKVDAGDIGAGHTVTALYEYRPAAATGALIEPLRYQTTAIPATGASAEEIAFLKIRYKLPEEDQSKLIEVPVQTDRVRSELASASNDSRFAAAVAAFGQILKGGKHTGDYSFEDVQELAAGARGNDPFNYRGSFLELVRLAQSAQAMEPLKK
ncbi:VWA domain-containing protein [Labrenzia sp. PHM005]|uniref:vWA domain-containing protein n=1 Tax=Labrenzia sp. PHM005 TaxID=2590016 RepID=UPI0011406568|nr:VWA domain-containing protein [Labrenzia sp. PHM005]QDG77127.1 VWA domain-containing protein [Labrenzia sp. PHM005]